MDFKKFIKIFVVGIVCLIAFGGRVEAAEDNILLELGDELNYSDEKIDKNTYFKKDTNSGNIIYCADSNKETSSSCPNYVVDSDAQNSKQLNYIFENGYYNGHSKNDYLTGDKNKDYYITQFAVWYYTNGASIKDKLNISTETYNGLSSDMTKKISRLIKDAGSKDKNPLLADKILTITSNSGTLTKNGDYFVSNEITVSGIGLKTKITLTVDGVNGVFITSDKNATSGSASGSFDNNSKVYIKVPINNMKSSDNITLNASAKYSSGTVKIYTNNDEDGFCSGPNSNIQRLTKWFPGEKETSEKISFGVDVVKVPISKKDITGKDELPGAHLVLKDSSGKVIAEWDSATTPKEVYLSVGDYSLTETIAPKGYKLSSETIKFSIKNDNKVYINGKVISEVVMKNEPIKVFISKRSINGKGELAGAKLAIYDKDGKIVKGKDGKDLEWVSTDTMFEIYLDEGEYILKEISAPSGYELSDKEIKFSVDKYGDVYIDKDKVKDNIIIFKNTPEAEQVPTGSAMFNIIIVIGILAIGISSYVIVKYYKKNYV